MLYINEFNLLLMKSVNNHIITVLFNLKFERLKIDIDLLTIFTLTLIECACVQYKYKLYIY